MDSVDMCFKELSMKREQFLQGPFSTQKSVEGVSPKPGRKIVKKTPVKKGAKSGMAFHEKILSALKNMGDSSDDKEAPVFHERFVSSIKSMGEACMDSMDHCYGEISDELSLNPKRVPESVRLHQRLYLTLTTMKDFYNCGGEGLDDETLDSDLYKVSTIS